MVCPLLLHWCTSFLSAPPYCNLSPRLACQASLNALVPPCVSLLDITNVTAHQGTSDQSMTSPRREWTTTGLNRDTHPSIALSQYGFVNIPSPPHAVRVVPNQRLLVDTPSTSNQIVMVDAPTVANPRVLVVSPTLQKACMDVPFPNNQKNLTDAPFLNAQRCMNDADCKRDDGLEGLLPRASQGVVPSLPLSSPLLFDSAPSVSSTPIPMPQKALQPSPTVYQRYTQPVASVVKCSSEALDGGDDSDVTPPISPQQQGSPDTKTMPGKQHPLGVIDDTKMPTSVHLKRNVRIARAKSCVESGVNIECDKHLTAFPILYAHVRCLCHESLCQGNGKLTSYIMMLMSLSPSSGLSLLLYISIKF